MSTSFDTSRFDRGIAKLRTDVRSVVERFLPVVVDDALTDPDYTAPTSNETGHGVALDDVITPLSWEGDQAKIRIRAVYDWVIDPESQHCSDPSGNDCPTFAANGPYTADFFARPGSGDTPCKDGCNCTWVQREASWLTSGPRALREIGAVIGAELEASWTSR